jgi:hypothetical protein
MIKLEFRNVDFCGGRKTREPMDKPLTQVRQSTTNATHMTHQSEDGVDLDK